MRLDWISARREGVFLPGAETWIDPSIPVARALVTHGHADHARSGHGETIATRETLAIMALRYGAAPASRPLALHERLALDDGIIAWLAPAGHVLGSAQVVLERGGERVVITGDYKRRSDPTCAAFEPVSCDVLITEATFALPVFVHPPIAHEIVRLLAAREANPQRCVLVGAYALGKAQRVIAELRRAGYLEPIWIHGALERMCALYGDFGIDLGDLRLVADAPKGALAGQIVFCPPAALNDRWSRRLPDPITAMASGWMRVRQRAVQRNVELPLVISDHADWPELTATIGELRPAETWITHGREDALVHWCALQQLRAQALDLVGYDDEDD
ncbi:MAG: ligase-associated DNA damage response exonuclease [Caulobacteraceae bacterium]|jgi:putative mRNA 3-end processing factor